MAPHFNSKTPSTLGTYLSDYESLAEAAQLSPEEHLVQSTCHLTGEDKEDCENLPEFEATPPNWISFKEALFWEYPKSRKPFISSANLDTFVEKKSSQEIHTLGGHPRIPYTYMYITDTFIVYILYRSI